MQNKRTLTMVDRFPKGEEGIPLAPKVPQKKNYMGPWNSCGFVTLKKTLGHGGQVFKIVEEGYPPRGKTWKCSNSQMFKCTIKFPWHGGWVQDYPKYFQCHHCESFGAPKLLTLHLQQKEHSVWWLGRKVEGGGWKGLIVSRSQVLPSFEEGGGAFKCPRANSWRLENLWKFRFLRTQGFQALSFVELPFATKVARPRAPHNLVELSPWHPFLQKVVWFFFTTLNQVLKSWHQKL